MLNPRLRSPAKRLLLAFACTAALLAAPVLAQQSTSKRPLNHNDYDSWKSIQGQKISPDGNFVAYALVPQDGDGEIVVRNLKTNAEYRQPRGKTSIGAPAKKGAAADTGFAGFPLLSFTADSRYLVY